MSKYVLAYHGGGMAETPEEQAAVMQAWEQWFGQLGGALVDGGAPIGRSQTIGSDGKVADGGGANPVSGYSILEAADLDAAATMAKGCPVLTSGGSVEVGEIIEM